MRKKGRKLTIFILIIMIIIIFSVGISILLGYREERKLKKQVKTYESYLKEDRINLNKIETMFEENLTTKDRLIVEKAYETYARDFASIVVDSEEILNSHEITVLLSAENYKKDGPNFIKSKKYIEDSIKHLKNNKDQIGIMRTENEALQYIEGKITKKYYKELEDEVIKK